MDVEKGKGRYWDPITPKSSKILSKYHCVMHMLRELRYICIIDSIENMFSSNDFNFLRDNGFADSYYSIANAMKYYNSDPEVACGQFRKALESVIDDVYSLFGETVDGHNKRDIDNLEYIVPRPFYDDNIILEMNNVRIIGNAYSHRNDDDERDVEKDRLTCYVAMKKISQWLVGCKQKYPEYIAEQEALRKQRKEKSKKFWKTVGKILAGGAAIAGAVLGGKKMFDK